MSEEAMLASLRDIHLPADAPGGLAAETAAALGLALLAALTAAAFLRLLSARGARAPADEARETRAAPEEARRIALLHQLRAQNPERYAALREGLYRPGGGPDIAALEAELSRDV